MWAVANLPPGCPAVGFTAPRGQGVQWLGLCAAGRVGDGELRRVERAGRQGRVGQGAEGAGRGRRGREAEGAATSRPQGGRRRGRRPRGGARLDTADIKMTTWTRSCCLPPQYLRDLLLGDQSFRTTTGRAGVVGAQAVHGAEPRCRGSLFIFEAGDGFLRDGWWKHLQEGLEGGTGCSMARAVAPRPDILELPSVRCITGSPR